MKAGQMVLVDTSVWVKYLREAEATESKALDSLLSEDQVAICGVVLAEILSGARSREDYKTLKNVLAALPLLEPPDDIWEQVAESRFLLAKKGIQQSLVDLFIALTARHHAASVWTLDKDFSKMTGVVDYLSFTL